MASRGLTLVELVVVMSIVGIIAVYAGAKWQGDLSFYSKADQLVNDIRRAQALAMGKDGNYTIRSVAADSYQIQDAAGTAVDPQATVLDRVQIMSFFITFNGRGDPGAVSQDVQLTLEGQTLTIRVYGNTGAVVRL
ncbi:MAG: prepilin-type N-terminal cleavage/methylation domain-containing protein [Magnetococcales bacterium]|nr:prepilin-type N-terminal cleavage/methylation domain-containing protein [Magnetococcales bacterium]